MQVLPIRAFTDNYIWAIVKDEDQTFIVVDPGEASSVNAFANNNQLTLRAILLTHHHADHIGGVDKLLSRFPGISVYGPADLRIPFVNRVVSANDVVQWETLSFQIIETPGHTATHISYYASNPGWLFCGDTLFSAGCGRVFDGTIEWLYQSLQTLSALPDDTKIYCAHEYTQQNCRYAKTVEPHNQDVIDYLDHLQRKTIACSLPSTLALEKKINPFLRVLQPAVKKHAGLLSADENNPLSVFQAIRDEKNQFSG